MKQGIRYLALIFVLIAFCAVLSETKKASPTVVVKNEAEENAKIVVAEKTKVKQAKPTKTNDSITKPTLDKKVQAKVEAVKVDKKPVNAQTAKPEKSNRKIAQSPKSSTLKPQKPLKEIQKAKKIESKSSKVETVKPIKEKPAKTKQSKIKVRQQVEQIIVQQQVPSMRVQYSVSKQQEDLYEQFWQWVSYLDPSSSQVRSCKTIKGITKCTITKKQILQPILQFFGLYISSSIFGIGLSLVVCLACLGKLKIRSRSSQDYAYRSVLKGLLQKVKKEPSQLKATEKQYLLDTIKTLKKMQMTSTDKLIQQNTTCDLTLTKLTSSGEDNHDVQFSGKDEKGRSKLRGAILFSGNSMDITLIKDYDDKKKAGKSNVLYYQLAGTPEDMKGTWAYAGMENSDDSSGSCTLKVV